VIITRKTTYALRALKHLAMHEGELTLTSRISEVEGIPQRFLEAILRELARHGVLQVKRGRGGGYSLRRSPHELTVAQVIDIVDGHASQFASTRSGRRAVRSAPAAVRAPHRWC
jgi:Rrf2 family protein